MLSSQVRHGTGPPQAARKPLALDNARGILCSSTPGKLYGRILRAAATLALVAEASGFQFGAVPGGDMDFPAAGSQTLLDGAYRRRRAVAVIFMDVKGAFCSILPEVALGPLVGEEQRLALFRKLGMDSAAVAALSEAILNRDTIIARHGVCP